MYEIEVRFGDTSHCYNAKDRKDVIDWLKLLKDEVIVDIRMVCRNGKTVSKMKAYERIVQKRYLP